MERVGVVFKHGSSESLGYPFATSLNTYIYIYTHNVLKHTPLRSPKGALCAGQAAAHGQVHRPHLHDPRGEAQRERQRLLRGPIYTHIYVKYVIYIIYMYYIYIYTHVCVHVHIHIYIYTYTHVCIYIYIYRCIYLSIYLSIYLCIHIYIYIHMHTHIHTCRSWARTPCTPRWPATPA